MSEDNSHLVFANKYISSILLPFLNVSEIENYGLVSKICRGFELQWWKHTYIVAAGLHVNPNSVEDASISFKRLYFHRFQRDELLMLLFDKYNNTQDIKLLRRFHNVARAAFFHKFWKSHGSKMVDLFDLEEFKERGRDASNARILSIYGTMYSPTNFKTAKTSIEIWHHWDDRKLNYITVHHIVVFYDGLAKAEHLGYSEEIEGRQVMTPDEEACIRFLLFLELNVSPMQLVIDFAKMGATALKSGGFALYGPDSVAFLVGQLVAKSMHASSVQFYNLLMNRTLDEIRKQEALQFAYARGLKPEVIQMLTKTTFSDHHAFCGRIYPQLFGSVGASKTINESFTTISLRQERLCMTISHTLEEGEGDNWNSRLQFLAQKAQHKSENNIAKPYFELSTDDWLYFVLRLGVNARPVDFFVYLLVCLDIVDYFYVKGNEEEKIWTVGSVEELGKYVFPIRRRSFADQTADIRTLHEAMKWDGSPHPKFTGFDWKAVEKDIIKSEQASDGENETQQQESDVRAFKKMRKDT